MHERDARNGLGWALGAILYELFTGQLAFAGNSVQEVLDRVLGESPCPIEALRDDVPRELTDVVRRISLLAQKNAPLRLKFAEGELTVSAQTPDVGEASETLPVPFAGEPFEIGFNPEFLRDGVESVDSDDLLLKLISPLRPGLIEAGDGSGFLYLIMPIRLNV